MAFQIPDTPTVLIIEDQPLLRNLLVRVLSRTSYRVLEAKSDVEAIRLSDHFKGSIQVLVTRHNLEDAALQQIHDSQPEIHILRPPQLPVAVDGNRDSLEDSPLMQEFERKVDEMFKQFRPASN